jgi:alpha-ketoglutarate-dependent taurine dioxygenase
MADPFASAKLLCELNDLADCFALSIGWQEQQFVMIDNTRFMHARSKYLGSARDVKYLCTYQYRTPAGI